MLGVDALVSDGGMRVDHRGLFEVRKLLARDRHVPHRVLVQPGRRRQIVADAEPAQRRQIRRPGGEAVVAQRDGLIEDATRIELPDPRFRGLLPGDQFGDVGGRPSSLASTLTATGSVATSSAR